MSEPKARAGEIERVAPGVWHWWVWDDRIDFRSDAHAVNGDRGKVLIDPLPLAPGALAALGRVEAICLTAACHQRSAWRYRRRFGVRVHAPEGTRPMEEEPDVRYRDGDSLPGGLRAVRTPGPEAAHYALWRRRRPAVVFCPDLVVATEEGTLALMPADLHESPRATRRSIRRLARLPASILCLDHGAPLTGGVAAALAAALRAG